jgi:BCCT family betaine/carnitine transporter
MKTKSVDLSIMLFPVFIVILLAVLIFSFPERANVIIYGLNDVFVNKVGVFYILFGLFVLLCSIYVAASKYGKIKLGDIEKPKYSNWRWGAMIFTATMAADILYWSLIEWGYYYSANPQGLLDLSDVQRQQIASTYPLFHWGPIPWAFYILPATAYAFMFFVWKGKRQTLSEACRLLLKDKVDGIWGKVIDIIAVVGFVGGTATTFALATPLITGAINTVFCIPSGKAITIAVLIINGIIFTVAVVIGMKAIARLAIITVFFFFALLLSVFILGPSKFIIESGVSAVGNVIQNFISMSTWTDPLRATGDGTSGFPQQWTIFYWAYWIAWFVATPFFIAKISEGRTIRNMISGAYFYGIAGTFTSFIIFGNFGLYQQVTGKVNAAEMLNEGVAPTEIIIQLFQQLPFSNVILVLLIATMIIFYASTFDAITLVVAGFCKKTLIGDEHPEKKLRIFWAFVFIILPIALIWSDSTLTMLQTISIIAAFPLALIMLIIIFGFLKELRKQKDT